MTKKAALVITLAASAALAGICGVLCVTAHHKRKLSLKGKTASCGPVSTSCK